MTYLFKIDADRFSFQFENGYVYIRILKWEYERANAKDGI